MNRLKARLILEDNGHILLLEQTSQNGGKYTLIGGTVDAKEYAMAALIRESMEEAGIDLLQEDLNLVHTLHKIKNGAHRIVLYFKAEKWVGIPKSREPKKFKKLIWAELETLPENTSVTVRHVLEHYRRGLNYSELSL